MRWLKRTDLQLFIFSVMLFTLWPSIDLHVSGLFYREDGGFIYAGLLPLELIYTLFAKLHLLLLPLLIVHLIRSYRSRTSDDFRRRMALFMLLSLLIGPGILANTLLKDNGIGRARPSQIEAFSGNAEFTAAFEYSGACRKNCSFVSGHAAMAFWLTTFAWLTNSRRVFAIVFSIGALVGLTRIVQGGHFISDVVFAFWLIHFTNLYLSRWMKIRPPLAPPRHSLAGAWEYRGRPGLGLTLGPEQKPQNKPQKRQQKNHHHPDHLRPSAGVALYRLDNRQHIQHQQQQAKNSRYLNTHSPISLIP